MQSVIWVCPECGKEIEMFFDVKEIRCGCGRMMVEKEDVHSD